MIWGNKKGRKVNVLPSLLAEMAITCSGHSGDGKYFSVEIDCSFIQAPLVYL